MKRRICVVTGSRAEYGLLYWVLHDLHADPDTELQLIVTGMHLSPEFGMTVREIERDGFPIARRVEMLLSSDTATGTAKSIGLGVIGMSEALADLRPDIVVLLGDRFEILAAAQACLIHGIPVAHVAGGDTTEGAYDEAIRHAVTKMSHLHFVTNDLSARRVRQLGEDPTHIHVVGSPGLDHLHRRPLLGRDDLAQALGRPLAAHNLLVTFHPVTLEPGEGERQCDELLAALAALPPDISIWITMPNADTGGRAIAARMSDWVDRHADRAAAYTSLGQLRYLSLMAQSSAVVGNSSSGLYEAPSLKVPTVDIGDRQRGRLRADSVLHCEAQRDQISAAIQSALRLDCTGVQNPYGDGRTAPRIVQALKTTPLNASLLKKSFHLMETPL